MPSVLKARFVDREAAAPEWQLIHRQADAVVPILRTVFVRAVRAVERETRWEEITVRLDAGRLDIEDLVPWGSIGAMALFEPFTEILGRLFARVGTLSVRRLPVFTKQFQAGVFQPGHTRARRWAEGHAADLIVQITDEQRVALRQAVVRAFEEGMPPRVLARDLRQLVGLTRQQATAVVNFRIELTTKGVTEEFIARRVERYAARLLRVRTEMIARTETIRASVEGQMEGWRQSREAGRLSRRLVKEWIVTPDDRLCPICAPLDEVQVDVDGMFDTSIGRVPGPPAHPQCRCAIGLNPPRQAAL